MATVESLELRVQAIESQIGELINKSLLPSELNSEQRKSIEDALFPIINGLRTRKIQGGNYTSHEVGDIIDHIDESNKIQYAGKVISGDFSGLTDINDPTKFDKYQSNKPAF